MDTFRKSENTYGSIKFIMYEGLEDCQGEAATQSEKAILTGKVSVTQALNQWHYGDQIIVQAYAKPGTIIKRERANYNYDRIQVFFKYDVFLDICRQLLKDVEAQNAKKISP
jgi:hypothetical protein